MKIKIEEKWVNVSEQIFDIVELDQHYWWIYNNVEFIEINSNKKIEDENEKQQIENDIELDYIEEIFNEANEINKGKDNECILFTLWAFILSDKLYPLQNQLKFINHHSNNLYYKTYKKWTKLIWINIDNLIEREISKFLWERNLKKEEIELLIINYKAFLYWIIYFFDFLNIKEYNLNSVINIILASYWKDIFNLIINIEWQIKQKKLERD